MKLEIMAMVAMFAFSVTYVFAEQQASVVLPWETPYENHQCTFQPTNIESIIRYTCFWEVSITDEDLQDIIVTMQNPPDPQHTDLTLDEVIGMIIDSRPQIEQEEEPIVEEEEVIPPTPIETLSPELREALDKLGECQFGTEGWAAFVGNYSKTVPDELPIFTSGLDKQRIINELARNFEECRGKDAFVERGWLSQEYENKFLADTLGLDYHGRAQTNFGLDDSRNYASQKTATNEEVQAQADYYAEWICKDENLYLGLCGHQFTGANRGGYSDGANCQQQGQPATEGGTAASNRCPLDEKAKLEAQEPTEEELWEKIYRAQCDNYKARYEYKAPEDRPDWVQHCSYN